MCRGTGNGTGNQTGNGMNKGNRVMAVLLTLVLGLCAAAPAVQAKARELAEAEQTMSLQTSETGRTVTWAGLSSRGSLVYRENNKGVQIDTADFLFLRDRIGMNSDTVFEPACYTHTHRWEYININGKTHIRHCDICGNTFDLVGAHKEKQRESCVLSHDGTEYSGLRYTCVCGYQWEQETAHTLFYEAVNEIGHRSRCRLDDTRFCSGYEPVIEEHYAYYYEPCEDGLHHEQICMDCGYRGEEECCFSLSDEDDSGENSSDGQRYCWCGNMEKLGTESGGENIGGETDDINTGTEAGDENVDTDTGDENTDAEAEDENADTGAEEENTDTGTGEEDTNAGSGHEGADTEGGNEDTDIEIVDENADVVPEEEEKPGTEAEEGV